MAQLNAAALEALAAAEISVTDWARANMMGEKWRGDICGCPDDRCIGFHHHGPDDCGCLPTLISEYLAGPEEVTAVRVVELDSRGLPSAFPIALSGGRYQVEAWSRRATFFASTTYYRKGGPLPERLEVPPPPPPITTEAYDQATIGDGGVSMGNYRAAMRLLGLDPEDDQRVLISVHIEAGRITAKLSQVGRIRHDPEPDPPNRWISADN